MSSETPKLQRRLKNRHIQLIAMGGAIGTGLFLGSAHIIESAGPSIILGYMIGGLIAFLIVMIRVAKSRRFNHNQATTAIVVSYYWHFVDVVWIALFAAIYLIK